MKIFINMLLSAVAGLSAFSCVSMAEIDSTPKSSSAKELASVPADKVTCYSGGEGNESCKIAPGIKIGDFITVECSVTCREGYYACCGERCICRPEKS